MNYILFHIWLEIICIIILCSPLIREIPDDRKGDDDKKRDVWIRIAIGAAASIFVWLISRHSLWGSAAMCFALFFLLFDYLINLVLKRPNPFEYLSTTTGTVDRIEWWVKIGPWWRFAIKFVVFAVALIIYF